MQTVFVYGTLKSRGDFNLGRAFGPARFLAYAQAQGEIRVNSIPYFLPYGARIADPLQSVPVLTSHDELVKELMPHVNAAPDWNPSPGVPLVHGELWLVSDTGLRGLDVLEGVRRHFDGSFNPASCHYLPAHVTVRYWSREHEVFTSALVYAYNVLHGPREWQRMEKIVSGSY